MSTAIHPIFVRAIQAIEADATISGTGGRHNPFRTPSGAAYIARIGSPREKDQIVGEAESLKAMNLAAPGLAPQLIASGVLDNETAQSDAEIGKSYLLCEYKDMSYLSEASGKTLAKRLATEMHAYKSTQGFGFHVPTFCGATKQQNGWYGTWTECYDALIGGLLAALESESGYESLCKQGKEL